MKIIQLIVFCSFLSISSFSQTVYQVDELRTYSWDDTAVPPDWQQDFTEQYTYGNGGNKETEIIGTSFPSLDNVSKHVKFYNSNNDIEKDELYGWDPTPPGSWKLISHIIYAYNTTTNNLISETTQTYNSFNSTFVNSTRELYEDYEGANAKKQTSQTWNLAAPGSWENVEKVDITYTSGLPTLALYSLWDSLTTMDWLPPYERDTATYTGGLLMEVLTEDLNDMNIKDRSTYTYTGGLLDMILFESSTDGGTNWDAFDRELSTYDSNGNNTVLIFEDNDTGPWVGYYKAERDFSVAAPLSANSFDKANFSVYPNPVNDVLYLDFKSALTGTTNVFLYGFDGRLIDSFDIKTNRKNFEMNFQNLSQGLYMLNIKGSNNEEKTLKIIKK